MRFFPWQRDKYQNDRQHPDGGGHHAVTVLPEQIADHVTPLRSPSDSIFGRNRPFESGQSSVANPASWLVTSAPAMIRKNVAPATSNAKRCRPLIHYFRFPIADCRLTNCRYAKSSQIANRQSAIGNVSQCLPIIGTSSAGIIFRPDWPEAVAASPKAKSALALPFAGTVTCIVFSVPFGPPFSCHAATV